MEPERLFVGRVIKPHGIRGEVAVEVVSDAPDRFAPGSRMRARERDVTVVSSRPHEGRMLVRFEEYPDRTAVEVLRGADLTIARTDARAPGSNEYYPFQLEGLEVVDEGGARLGKMLRVEESPASDLWVVGVGAREVLVPAVRDIVVSVDLETRRIVIKPPQGLFE